MTHYRDKLIGYGGAILAVLLVGIPALVAIITFVGMTVEHFTP